MNCLYITLFLDIVAGIVRTFIKSWNQFLYPRVIEVCRQPFEPRHDFFLHLIIVVELFSQRDKSLGEKQVEIAGRHKRNNLFVNFHWTFTFCVDKSYDGTHLAFGGTLDQRCHFKDVSLKTKPVLPLSNEHGSQVKDQGRRHRCHNKHKKFPYRPTRDVSLLSRHALYLGDP